MIFILDNFDSFTYNLYQYFGELGEQVIVRRRDQCTLEDIAHLNPELIVISPGPCTPADAPLTLEVLEHFKGKIPILGICLGHQAIGQVFGAAVKRAFTPMHGKTCKVNHDNQGVFANLPRPLTVTRYHSLVIDRESIPPELLITATSDDGEIMGVRHRYYPLEGVQFHPEAILTEAGHALLQNALDNARAWKRARLTEVWHTRPLSIDVPPIELLPALQHTPYPFFLDSGHEISDIGRYSYLGAWPFLVATAYPDKVILHWPNRKGPEAHECIPVASAAESSPECIISAARTVPESSIAKSTLAVLDRLLAKYRLDNPTPFPFVGGAVGFFSYDLKDELEQLPSIAQDDLHIPLWRLAWYDGIVVYDHTCQQYYLVACGMQEDGSCASELAQARLDRLEELLKRYAVTNRNAAINLSGNAGVAATQEYGRSSVNPQTAEVWERDSVTAVSVELTVSREDYLRHLRRVIDYIYAGDIYQANLTQRFNIPWSGDPWQLYRKLHETNPAPFAAFLPYEDFQILSCSPERFITIDKHGRIETRPIKGTRPRGQTPEEDQALAEELLTSVKDRAELTMIIDLERNDIGRICEFGTVKVEDLIRLEKYPTVWHLVSTISGCLRQQVKPSEILKAVFPGGSITGAPKIRAMEIIEELEPYKRGVYTGSIGYLGFDGCWDLNIVIRTVLLKDGMAYVHAGGGIVADSVPEREYEETLHKAKALFKGLGGRWQ